MKILILLVVIFCAFFSQGCAGMKEYLTTPRNLSYWEQLGPDYVKCHKTLEIKFCRAYGPYMVCECYAKKK